MRTYNRASWVEAQALWDEGGFSPEWRNVRHAAAMRGMLYPPEGTKFDSWEDDQPSQRAMLIRAIRETPKLLDAAIARGSSWGEVIAYLVRRRDEYREQGYLEDRATARRREDDPTHIESAQALAGILARLDASR